MKYRKLRIAGSVICGIACVLLIALWMSSYWRMDSIDSISATGQYSGLTSLHGRITLVKGYNVPNPFREFIFAVPHWFVSLVFFLAAAAPWLRWRFSLRTLLTITTLVAILLGLIVWGNR